MTGQGTDIVTWGSCIFIAILFAVFLTIKKKASSEFLLSHKRTVDAFPSIISTLLVICTFVGITLGLHLFDVTDLTQSIPILLGGLKTAFFTSLCGMLGSLILRHFCTDIKYDKENGGIYSTDAAIRELDYSQTSFYTLVQQGLIQEFLQKYGCERFGYVK